MLCKTRSLITGRALSANGENPLKQIEGYWIGGERVQHLIHSLKSLKNLRFPEIEAGLVAFPGFPDCRSSSHWDPSTRSDN